ncbi:hypothetical protein FQN54_003668 [Arachnomyces sp. PD_36]|nr:hypothetical protein FQN54_003668 [Arachnomyces sp. PD_36]
MKLGWLQLAALGATGAAAAEDSRAFSPPHYPSPWARGSGDWASAYSKAHDFVSQLTLPEKVNLTTGTGWMSDSCVGEVGSIPRLNFRGLCLQDAPLGVRFADYVSAFPSGVNVAATWDRHLAYLRGKAMGAEHRDKGVDVQLGPVAGPIGRSPDGGRNWEGFSPDPVNTGIMMAETIQGIQDSGVIACAKHYIANEQEMFRQAPEAVQYGHNISEAASSNIDDKTMHELYLWPFADAVRAGVGSVMCSYTQINNSYGCHNSYTQNKLLKGELDFQGFILSDWQAHHSGVGSALAGLDMSMPGDTVFNSGDSFWGTNLTISVVNGTVPEWRVDDMAVRIMAAYYKVGRDEAQVPINFNSWSRDSFGPEHAFVGAGWSEINEHVDVRADHRDLIRKIGAASTVLLKNEGALPLTGKEKFTAIIGEDAGSSPNGPNGCADHGCDDGTLAMGWGSGTSDFPYLITPEQAIQNKLASEGSVVNSIPSNYATEQIETLAAQAGVALVFVNADSGEGYINVDGNIGDRKNLTLWNDGDNLIKTVAAINPNTVVVMHTVGPVLVSEWYDHPNVTAILWAGLPGEQSGNAIVDVLYGDVNPGGKTPFTWGETREAYGAPILRKPNDGTNAPQIDFTEGVFIDYRAFDQAELDPIYEFGFGLSYTNFSYANIDVQSAGPGPYKPTSGKTEPAPVLGDHSKDYADYVFPENVSPRIPLYLYPWLNTTDPRESSGDKDYGMPLDEYVPTGARDGSPQELLPAGGAPGGNPGLYDTMYTITATISNTGEVYGEEVPQLYLSLGGPDDPKVVLRNFDRIGLAPGEDKGWITTLTRRDISNWDPASQDWVISEHPKKVYVGSSSRKLHLEADLPPF